tara:strand:+ start:48244 stop:48855 length:612 start_codon:yes stop_codon:yes gene_type:complete
MNFKYLVICICISIIYASCETKEKIAYKYQDYAQPIACEGIDKALLHEALYTFQHDIAKRYNLITSKDSTAAIYIMNGYGKYISRGTSGTASYDEIKRSHTERILEALLKEAPEIWIIKPNSVQLNYDAPFVACLLENFTNQDVKKTMTNLREANSYRLDYMAEVFRKNISDVAMDPHFAMYLALDTYYRNLILIQQLNQTND